MLWSCLAWRCCQDKKKFKGRKRPYECEDIRITENQLSGRKEWKLPEEMWLSPVNFTKIRQESIVINLLRFYISSYPYETATSGIYFKLANGELVKSPYEDVKIGKEIAGKYSIMCGYVMSDELIEKLKTNFVVQFSLGEIIIDLDERHQKNLQSLFKCMFVD